MTNKPLNIAIVGATGAVGQLLISLLIEHAFPVASLTFLASSRSAGKKINFQGDELSVQDLAEYDFNGTDIAFFSAGAAVSKTYAPKAAAAGALVIDNTSCFRYDDDIPLVVPEINPEEISKAKRGIIANPNCSTIQMLMAIYPIHQAVGIKRVIVSTYQAISGAGQQSIEDLQTNIRKYAKDGSTDPKQLAMNVIPQIDTMQENGYTREEMKMLWETQKILSDPNIKVSATAVRVPVINGHSEAITIETKTPITSEEVEALLNQQDGVTIVKEPLLTPLMADGQNNVFVSRIRQDLSFNQGVSMWVVADNLRKGAATNAIQIAEKYCNSLNNQ